MNEDQLQIFEDNEHGNDDLSDHSGTFQARNLLPISCQVSISKQNDLEEQAISSIK